MPLIDSLNDFRNSITEANNFISIAFRRNRARRYILAANERDFITDSSYLKIFIAWETFLESSFIRYMMGEPSARGLIVTKYVNPLDENHAHRLIIGTQKYVDWSNPDIVRKLSNLHFVTGNPFDTFLSSIHADLLDMKTIRNAAAHLTSTTNSQLDALATRLLRRSSTNMTVTKLIFANDPNPPATGTILTTYLQKIDVAAEGITNG